MAIQSSDQPRKAARHGIERGTVKITFGTGECSRLEVSGPVVRDVICMAQDCGELESASKILSELAQNPLGV
eukprot:2218467-Amphidinium_carterae.1